MQAKYIAFFFAQLMAVMASSTDAPEVLTLERVYHTIINQSPYLVERTTTITWTQSATVTVSDPTAAPTPTIAY